MWELDNSYYFFGLLVIPLIVGIFVWYNVWRKKAIKRFGTGVFLQKLSPNLSKNKLFIKLIALCAAVVMLIFALVNPKFGTNLETIKRQGIDIVFAIDVSKSMLAEDIKPNRMEKAKHLASQIINHLGSDRIGIVGYAGSAFPMLPITTDYNIAKLYLQDLNTDMVSSMGTALSNAIELSSESFDNPLASKVIILISDGEDHNEGIDEAINLAKEKNIKILTIGVGTTNGTNIPIKQNGNVLSYKQDENGNPVITKLNETTLKKIAKQTGSIYLYGTKTKEVVTLVKKHIDNLQKTELETKQMANFQQQFQWFLALAILILLIDLFVSERKTLWFKKINLFNEK